ncbi:MAG TPA: hypothetical protein PLW93_02925, partial [Candidatus Absconditabacterales bacterium]|nr:hypothetical protein [Candidatus Absconditabacterales bacterium]
YDVQEISPGALYGKESLINRLKKGDYGLLETKKVQKYIKNNYDGFIAKDYGNKDIYGVLNLDKIKTEKQLRKIREQANKKSLPPLPKKGMPKLGKETLEQNISGLEPIHSSMINKIEKAKNIPGDVEIGSLHDILYSPEARVMLKDVHNIKVYMVDYMRDGEIGMYTPRNNVIMLSKSIPKGDIESTIAHEAVHALRQKRGRPMDYGKYLYDPTAVFEESANRAAAYFDTLKKNSLPPLPKKGK